MDVALHQEVGPGCAAAVELTMRVCSSVLPLFLLGRLGRLQQLAAFGQPGQGLAAHPARNLVGEWDAPPRLPPLPSFSDGPFIGNGDLGVTWGGPPERSIQYVSQKSFWTGAFFLGGSHSLQRRWGMLLAATVTWEMPGLAGANYSASMDLWRSEVNLTFASGRKRAHGRMPPVFHSNTFVGQDDTPTDVNFFVTEFGITSTPVNLTLHINPGNPAVPSPYNAGKSWGGNCGSVSWQARNNTANEGPVTNPYDRGPGEPRDTFNDTKLTCVTAASIYAADGLHTPNVRRRSRSDGNHTLSLLLEPGRRYALVLAAATHQCGTLDPVVEACRIATSVASQSQRATARTAAREWWLRQWATTPIIRHFSTEAEEFYYGTLFTMASSKRAGTVGIDRQGPFMNQDNSMWPYICNNYNLQAPYFGMGAANQQWMFEPMFRRVMQSVPLFKQRASHLLINIQRPELGHDNPPASSFGHYDGIEMPGHIGCVVCTQCCVHSC